MANQARLKKIAKILLAGGVIAVAFPVIANLAIIRAAEGKIFHATNEVPANRVALVLGTAPTVQGRKNLYFERRMAATAALYRSAKVDKILVSGDNGRRTYDEPTAMKNRLIDLGVPASAIVCDFAGFRTLDSLVRAKKVFGQDKLTVVTDEFHLPRALFLADRAGIEAVGFSTEGLPSTYSPATEVRELGARTMVCIDVLTGKKPKFLGPRESI